ncbi:hypothetical protein BS50DRAFT_573961 [Corynespora cassiicola Philippines]|uniref:Uncharacterized protein n=1 Tax=Corynespora cassiicola Philippines TaxID=1448308 RepID=A0A2T2NP62_CORCC|nr:hypothetical protein BS50DRAFT_573961 [Corynespora cassiicola Philippines]
MCLAAACSSDQGPAVPISVPAPIRPVLVACGTAAHMCPACPTLPCECGRRRRSAYCTLLSPRPAGLSRACACYNSHHFPCPAPPKAASRMAVVEALNPHAHAHAHACFGRLQATHFPGFADTPGLRCRCQI